MILYVKDYFLTAIPQSSRRNIQRCIVSWINFSFKFILNDWQKFGFYLNISIHLSHYLCLRVAPQWSVTAQFAYKAVIHRVCLSTYSEWACPLPSIQILCRWHPGFLVFLMHIYNLIALIGNAESHENAPVCIAPFICCCDSVVNCSNSLFQQLQYLAFFSCRTLLFMVLV